MKELLPLFPRPSHYLGNEINAVHKDPHKVAVHLALAFPDLYDVGMSYLGQKILYEIANQRDDVWAERVFAPTQEVAAILKEHQTPLASLESDTPLGELDAIAFSITHELCYTNILYMLDLAGIPLWSRDRGDGDPLIIAGGGCTLNAEPVAPFCDVMVLGDGEETLMDLMDVIRSGKRNQLSREAMLREMASIAGVYIPAFFQDEGPGKPLRPLYPDLPMPERRSVADINTIDFPVKQILPYGKPVHDRLTVEIARGCTRGCRFCHAGMVYRPVRERSLDELKRIIDQGLEQTGYEEISFLSLSTGDFSAFQKLFMQTFAQCRSQQVSISLPSLRAGSVNESLLTRMAEIRHTGMTVAPEAGTQRLRDVINKGITQEEILEHSRMVFAHGWQSIKLYFMIGLPTETREDLDGILDLCLKVRDTAGKKAKRMQITAAISPFVPKPFTPFQWEPQITVQEIEERLQYLREIFKPYGFLHLKWHHSHMSFLEGIFSRGDRKLAQVIARAFHKGALFSSWSDHLCLDLWLEAMDECGCDPEAYIGGRDLEAALPWDHINAGVSKRFLRTERARALGEKSSPDCRYNPCRHCGVCGMDGQASILTQTESPLQPILNNADRDQHHEEPCEDVPNPDQEKLIHKACHYRVWYRKMGLSIYLSQLELQRIFERALRRAGLATTFSAGFHPMPLMSFGMALPVGVGSQAEWVNIYFREELSEEDILTRMDGQLPQGMRVLAAQPLSMGKKQPQAVAEEYSICFQGTEEHQARAMQAWQDFISRDTFLIDRTNKRGRVVQVDLRSFVRSSSMEGERVKVVFDWAQGYTNPLNLLMAVCPHLSPMHFTMVKERQIM
ncbi:TIGR03960 family B12-binding radical SAM protein [Desulfoplanes formicivorans]|uniref:Radical SAM protein n=1 Tax=Desulfoplanes formicivorans TaxID=1592317 RepID=A0A194AGE8_9BACT|nr:TIGR03960 family B12-binding radical SAM protein [Desulfoplanes formicivorans]GAU09147.1 radical SAM protein [Desulfoplanes formicivorans]